VSYRVLLPLPLSLFFLYFKEYFIIFEWNCLLTSLLGDDFFPFPPRERSIPSRELEDRYLGVPNRATLVGFERAKGVRAPDFLSLPPICFSPSQLFRWSLVKLTLLFTSDCENTTVLFPVPFPTFFTEIDFYSLLSYGVSSLSLTHFKNGAREISGLV